MLLHRPQATKIRRPTRMSKNPDAFLFDEGQRQSQSGILLEAAYLIQKIVKAFWAVVVVILLRAEDIGLQYLVSIPLAILVIVLIGGYLSYRNFIFRIDTQHQEFVLQKGIFNKKQVVLQLEKIQQVNINQNFIQKLIQVYGVEIETAGSAKSEVTIGAVSKPVALALKSRLMEEAATSTGDEVHEKHALPQSFIKISPLSLVKMGLTSRYVESFFLLLAFISAIFNNVKDIFWNNEESEDRLYQLISSYMVVQGIAMLIIAIFIVTIIFNLVRTILVYYDLTITKQARSLNISYGLFNSKSTVIHPRKVQKISYLSNYFQRKMDLYELCIQQPTSDIHTDKKAKIHMPGCNRAELKSIIKTVLDKDLSYGKLLKPNIRKIITPLVFLIALPLLIFLLVTANYAVVAVVLYMAPIYLLIACLFIYLAYRNNRLYINQDFIIKQSGIWDIKTDIIEPYKIQAITIKQSLWHRRSNIGHMVLHTAGGDLSFSFGDFTELKRYADILTYQIETSTKSWM